MNDERIFLCALNSFPRFGSKRLMRLKKFFGTWQAALNATNDALLTAGIAPAIASEFISFRKQIDLVKLERELTCDSVTLLVLGDKEYPKLLSEIYDPPPLIFCRGNIALLSSLSLAIVGTRKCSPYGRQACLEISGRLAKEGFTIVSGLALGIDSIAHQECLDCQGSTIAVLGSGVDKRSVYPATNRQLSERIIKQNGAVISEFPLGSIPQKFNFPLRNRIISGLTIATIVIEAAEKSGALITAQSALDQGRELFAVPGSIFSAVSAGPNSLIRQGANPIASADDILGLLDLKRLSSYISNNKIKAESPEEEALLALLGQEPLHIDDLKRQSGLSTPSLSATMTMLEMKGIVRNLGGNRYVII